MPDQRVTASSPDLRSAVPVTPLPLDRWVLPTLIGLSAVACIPVWEVQNLPLQDLGLHLNKVDLLLRYLSGDPSTKALYRINWTPFPDWTCFALLTLFAPLLGIITAARLYLSACIFALPLAAYLWMKRVNPAGLLLVLAVPAIAHNLFLAKGNLNFCAALVLYLLALAVWESQRRWLFTVVATILYLTHGIVFFSLVGTTALRLAFNRDRSQLRQTAGLLPGIACFAIALLLNRGTSRPAIPWPLLAIPGRDDLLAAIPWLFGPSMPRVMVVLWVLVLLACLLTAFLAPVRSNQQDAVAESRWLWLTVAVAFGLAFVFCTTQIGEWSHFRQRFLPLSFFAVLGVVQAPRQPFVRMLLITIFVTTAVVGTLGARPFYRRGDALVSEYLQAVTSLAPQAAWLPLDFPNDVDWVRPALHAWGFYQLAQPSIWSPYVDLQMTAQAGMIYPVLYRVRPWAPPQSAPDLDSTSMQRIAACYDFIVIWDATPASAAAVESYYERIEQTPHVQVWRNRHGVRGGRPDTVAACRWDAPA